MLIVRAKRTSGSVIKSDATVRYSRSLLTGFFSFIFAVVASIVIAIGSEKILSRFDPGGRNGQSSNVIKRIVCNLAENDITSEY